MDGIGVLLGFEIGKNDDLVPRLRPSEELNLLQTVSELRSLCYGIIEKLQTVTYA